MLDGSPNAWLGSMMQAFSKGDIDAFNQLCMENQEVRLAGGGDRTIQLFGNMVVSRDPGGRLCFCFVIRLSARKRALPLS